MNITSAKFIKGIVEADDLLEDGTPQVAFVGRSNVGKSSVINSLAGLKGLAHTSSFPGHTQEINIFLVNKLVYLVDLPGYGFAKADKQTQKRLQQLIYWYLLDSDYEQKKIVLIIDAVVGFTETDLQMLSSLEDAGKDVVIIANKVDKLKPSEYRKQLEKITDQAGGYKVIAYSAEKRIGVGELTNQVLV
jgi:GTP-binding protein